MIENGFYYDLDLSSSITVEDFPIIEKEMKNIIHENLNIERIEISREAAEKFFKEADDHLKLELFRSNT